MVDPTLKRARLAARVREPRLISAPGIFEMISARIADRMDFDCLYMTGYGVVASYLGLPDAGIATYTDMVNRVAQFAQVTTTPFIADGDTGYGGLLNVAHAVRGYEAAGACGIQIEDQEFPKKCGHMLGRRVIAMDDMAAKVRVAAQSRTDANFLIVARTDARTTHGLDDALRRAEAYLRAGADVLFVESPESVEDMVEGGRTPVLSAADLEAIGYRIAIFPATGFLATAAALESVYAGIRTHGSSMGGATSLYPFAKMSQLMGFDEVAAFDARHRADGS